MKIVALEEHIVPKFTSDAWEASSDRQDVSISFNKRDLLARLSDVGQGRLRAIDESGVDVQVLSLPAPGLHNFTAREAVPLARDFNDLLAETIRQRPTRFEGFATLPSPDPRAAAHELERAVTKCRLKGALLSGRVQQRNMDHPDFDSIYEAAANLNVPLYVHPQLPQRAVFDSYYRGFGDATDLMFAMGAIGWHYETGIQLLRLIMSGVFDRHPKLQLITGHWGEVVLFYLDRIALLDRAQLKLKRPVVDYFRQNIYYTPSGILSQAYLQRTIDIVGVDRMMFSQDYPYHFARDRGARNFLEQAALLEREKEKIASANWEGLFAVQSSRSG